MTGSCEKIDFCNLEVVILKKVENHWYIYIHLICTYVI